MVDCGEAFLFDIVAMNVNAVDVGPDRHECVVFVADGRGHQYVSVAVAEQLPLHHAVTLRELELDAQLLLSVKDGEMAGTSSAYGIKDNVARIGDRYIAKGGSRASLRPVGFELMVVKPHFDFGSLNIMLGYEGTGQQLPVGRNGIGKGKIVASLPHLAEKNIRCTLRLESGKAAAVVIDTQTCVGYVGEKKVYMRTVNIAPIAGGPILRREKGAALFLQAVVCSPM